VPSGAGLGAGGERKLTAVIEKCKRGAKKEQTGRTSGSKKKRGGGSPKEKQNLLGVTVKAGTPRGNKTYPKRTWMDK